MPSTISLPSPPDSQTFLTVLLPMHSNRFNALDFVTFKELVATCLMHRSTSECCYLINFALETPNTTFKLGFEMHLHIYPSIAQLVERETVEEICIPDISRSLVQIRFEGFFFFSNNTLIKNYL